MTEYAIEDGIAAELLQYTLLFSVLRHLIDQRSMSRGTIILGFYNIKTIISEHSDGIGENDEQWRRRIIRINKNIQ